VAAGAQGPVRRRAPWTPSGRTTPPSGAMAASGGCRMEFEKVKKMLNNTCWNIFKNIDQLFS
jgi:hypothetical protein